MYNWNTDISVFKKSDEKFIIWKLSQMINYGLGNEKLNLNLVKKFWKNLDLDSKRKKFLMYIIWGKLS